MKQENISIAPTPTLSISPTLNANPSIGLLADFDSGKIHIPWESKFYFQRPPSIPQLLENYLRDEEIKIGKAGSKEYFPPESTIETAQSGAAEKSLDYEVKIYSELKDPPTPQKHGSSKTEDSSLRLREMKKMQYV